mmetsp:Transcript_20636/g.31174  ORF Transcript_20636/g.31174 Transcript_20636/m.31174 type:complete len:209 (-) Transcript_20636:440-1066(-)
MKTFCMLFAGVLLALFLGMDVQAFSTSTNSVVFHRNSPITQKFSTQLRMAKDEEGELKKMARSARKAGPNDRVVEIRKPLGLILEEDERGNVYVASVSPGGNAARSKKIGEGDKIVMISATFGDELWSTRGVGLNSIMKAIQVRAAPQVKLVLESTEETGVKASAAASQAQAKREKEESEKQKRDRLLKELEATESRIKSKNKFFGLF